MDRAKEKRRIVMVDDEPEFLSLVGAWLSRDYEVVALPDGAQLPVWLARTPPALLILDVRVPGADGFELCRRLRADRRCAALPVLFLTGSHEAVDYFRTLRAGGTSYLMKPVGRKQLLAAVSELIEQPVEYVSTGGGD